MKHFTERVVIFGFAQKPPNLNHIKQYCKLRRIQFLANFVTCHVFPTFFLECASGLLMMAHALL